MRVMRDWMHDTQHQILRAVSGILRTHRGRRGSGLGRQRAVATCAAGLGTATSGHRGFAPPPFAPAAQLFARVAQPFAPRPCGSTLRPCGSTLRPSPLWLSSSPVWLASLSPGRRRAVTTSHWPWVSSRAARRRAGSPARIATAVYVGAQWGWLWLARPGVDRLQHRVP
jgi:hypothetical protein